MKLNQKGAVPILAIIILVLVAFVGFNFISGNQVNQQLSPTKNGLVTPLSQGGNTPKESTPSAVLAAQNLKKYLVVESALLGVSDNISLYFKDLGSEQEVTLDPTRSWIPASTIKAFVALEAFRQRDLGLINFDQAVTITSPNVAPTELETDDFPRLREGTVATVQQLVEAMIIQSDNTAYNTLLDLLDRRNINTTIKALGFTETVVGEKLNLDDSQFAQDLQVPGRQPNTTTVKDFATLFDYLYSKKINDSDEIMGIFKRQKINNMIPALLPANTIIAHKTGDWVPIYHDGGVIFKPTDPFVLAVFTNGGDPSVVSRMARVAYFQTVDSVGKNISLGSPVQTATSEPRPIISLATPPDQMKVLGESATQLSTITAADLGITAKDFYSDQSVASSFNGALIVPGSPLYGIKVFFENMGVNGAVGNSGKARAYINLGKARLAEAKTMFKNGDVLTANALLNQSESDLERATTLAGNDSQKDQLFLDIKQVSNLHYSVLSQSSTQISDDKKAEFIDTVYNFYQKNHAAVAPIINSSVVSNPTQQKPTIGTIISYNGNSGVIKFDDGSTKQMILPDIVQVRSFQQDTYQTKNSLSTGDRVAVVGVTNDKSQIVPQFILKNVPKELPSKHTGTVIEINPNQNVIKILDQNGKEELIKIDANTSIRSTDTDVSVEGIKAGSEITIFGTSGNEVVNPTSNSKPNDLISIPVIGGVLSHFIGPGGQNEASLSSTQQNASPTPVPSGKIINSNSQGNQQSSQSASLNNNQGNPQSSYNPTSSLKSQQGGQTTPSNKPSGSPQPSSTPKPNEIVKATTIIVVGNGSGSKEKVTPPPSKSTSKPSSHNSSQPSHSNSVKSGK